MNCSRRRLALSGVSAAILTIGVPSGGTALAEGEGIRKTLPAGTQPTALAAGTTARARPDWVCFKPCRPHHKHPPNGR